MNAGSAPHQGQNDAEDKVETEVEVVDDFGLDGYEGIGLEMTIGDSQLDQVAG